MAQTQFKTRLKDIIQQFSQTTVLVVGDIAIDEMIYGETARLSREAPVLILKHQRSDILLGAAGNAAHNLASLSAKQVYLAGVSGSDDYREHLLKALRRDGIETTALVADASRPTTTKSRISGQARQSVRQQIVRIDRESDAPIAGDVEKRIISALEELAPQCQAILLSDYNLGVITPTIIETCRRLASTHNIVWAVDSQRPLTHFRGASIASPNQPEAEQNVGVEFNTRQEVEAAGQQILEQTGLKNLLITRGGEGMCLFEGSPRAIHHIPVFNRSEVFDVTGAGDTVIASLTLALASGASLLEASILGNLAASLVVKHYGTAVTTPEELIATLDEIDWEILLPQAIHKELFAAL